jgi:hypothetical protein
LAEKINGQPVRQMADYYIGFPKWATEEQKALTWEYLQDYATRNKVLVFSLNNTDIAPFIAVDPRNSPETFKNITKQLLPVGKELKKAFPFIKQPNSWIESLFRLHHIHGY